MIRSVRREEIPLCVRVIRQSHRMVADQFGITEENAPRYVAFATDENRLLWHMDNEHRLMYLDEEDGVIRGYYSLLPDFATTREKKPKADKGRRAITPK